MGNWEEDEEEKEEESELKTVNADGQRMSRGD